MNWQGRRRSGNVEDRRGVDGRGIAIGGGLGGVVLLVLYLLLGGNPADLSRTLQAEQPAAGAQSGTELSREQTEIGDFVSVVLADTEDLWTSQFRQMGRQYRPPHLVLFSGSAESACGYAGSSVGPFYCPGDEKVYIDLDYFADMQRELDAPGDFALGYVIAHEVGHHVQNLLGIMDEVTSRQKQAGESESNRLSVRLELQADFLAGMWAHFARQEEGYIDQADIREGLNAASAVGDDRIQNRSRGTVVPDSFTHGTSDQRVRWFKKGMETGDLRQGDTFAASRL
jgi:uncharacterized protein